MGSLLIQTSFIGDVILTTPLIAALAQRGPVDVVAAPGGAAVLEGNRDVRRIIVYDKRHRDRGLAGFRRLARQLAADPHATAYLAQGSVRSAMLARAAGCKVRIGFDTSAGRALYTHRVPFRRDRHHAERLLRLAVDDAAEFPRAMLRPRLFPGEDERAAVSALLERAPNANRPLVALAPGSVWATKRWPYFTELAAALLPNYRVVVVGSGDDSALAAEILTVTAGDAIDATGRLTLLGSAELIRRCRALVTNDSAPLHLASAMNTPTVAVFGPTVPAFGFGPLADRAAIAEHTALSCRPCHPHGPRVCPLGHWRCMRDLAVGSVLEQLAAIA